MDRQLAHASQLQVQIYVNRFSGDLSKAVLEALPSLAEKTKRLGWTASLEAANIAEPQDAAFLRAGLAKRSDYASHAFLRALAADELTRQPAGASN